MISDESSGVSGRFGNRITGSGAKENFLQELVQRYRSQIEPQAWKVAILKFASPEYVEPSEWQQRELSSYRAAQDSANQKIPTFEQLGFSVPRQLTELGSCQEQPNDWLKTLPLQELPQTLQKEEFQQILDTLNQDSSVKGIIVQNPVPDILRANIRTIASDKDWDSLSVNPRFDRPATSEAITRVANQFLNIPNSTDAMEERDSTIIVAVVGSKGFVGRGVISWLEQQGVRTIGIDKRDDDKFYPEDLDNLWNADVVITTTGYPGLLTERHLLPQHRVVLDCGYVPVQEDGKTKRKGDIDRNAVHIPQHYTPVPGGTGPMEMIILGERAVIATVDPTLERWQLPRREFLGRESIHQLQSQWAQDLYPTAQALFNHHTDAVQSDGAERILAVEGAGDYHICINDAEQTLTVLAGGNRQLNRENEAPQPLVLAWFNMTTGKVEGVIKLNEQDHLRWQEIAASLNQDIDRTTTESLDRTEPDAPPDNPPPSAPIRPRPTPQTPSGGIASPVSSSDTPASSSTQTSVTPKDSIDPQDANQPKLQADSLNLTPPTQSTLQGNSKQQERIAREIYPPALELSKHSSATEVAPGIREVKGDYRLVSDTNRHQLSIHRNSPTSQVLAQYNTETGQLIAAQGLTESDRRSWAETAKELNLQSQQVDRSSAKSTQSFSEQRSTRQKLDARSKPKQQGVKDYEQ